MLTFSVFFLRKVSAECSEIMTHELSISFLKYVKPQSALIGLIVFIGKIRPLKLNVVFNHSQYGV